MTRRLALWVCLAVALAAPERVLAGAPAAAASDSSRQRSRTTQANVMVEIAFEAAEEHRDPFNDITLDVVFVDPSGRKLRVPAFWAGGRAWKVRYASPLSGAHRFRSVCSPAGDRGLDGVEGTVTVEPYTGRNDLYRHGPIRVAADRRHFACADGTPFFWLGDTWWMGLCRRLHWPDEFQALAADRKGKGFNVIQIVAGLYPDMPPFDPRGANEAGFPWDTAFRRIQPGYFDCADRRLLYLADQGFVPCIVGAWGFHIHGTKVEGMKRHWRYLIARYGALPVVWCAAGEGTMPYYLSTRKKEDGAVQKEGWTEVIRYIRATDPFGRLVTIHPSGSARNTVTDPTVLDFDMHQTGHRPESGLGTVIKAIRQAYAARPTMPVISGEMSYEGLDLREWGGGVLSTDASRQMFWATVMADGIAGGTYGANGVWQVNRRGAPFGPSPHGRNWGSVPWDEAMRRPGSGQVGLAKRFLESYPWHRCQPIPDGADWDEPLSAAQRDIVPLAAGAGLTLRIVYAPRPRPVLVKQLAPEADYAAIAMDPVTGKQSPLGRIRTDKQGAWRCANPVADHDWAVVLQR